MFAAFLRVETHQTTDRYRSKVNVVTIPLDQVGKVHEDGIFNNEDVAEAIIILAELPILFTSVRFTVGQTVIKAIVSVNNRSEEEDDD